MDKNVIYLYLRERSIQSAHLTHPENSKVDIGSSQCTVNLVQSPLFE